MVGFIYVFGFVMMTPQLFINYKLKSVAHLPWRAMIYKSINTFIDDVNSPTYAYLLTLLYFVLPVVYISLSFTRGNAIDFKLYINVC